MDELLDIPEQLECWIDGHWVRLALRTMDYFDLVHELERVSPPHCEECGTFIQN